MWIRYLPVRFKLCACPTERNVIGRCVFLNNLILVWIRACPYTASHQRHFWIFFIATGMILHGATTTCSIASFVCPSGRYLSAFGKAGPCPLCIGGRWTFESVSNVTLSCPSDHLSAFGMAGPWSLSAGGRCRNESVSNVTLSWFRFFWCFVWETRTAGERFRLQILRKSSIKRRRMRKRT
jgi:hypothetical protein